MDLAKGSSQPDVVRAASERPATTAAAIATIPAVTASDADVYAASKDAIRDLACMVPVGGCCGDRRWQLADVRIRTGSRGLGRESGRRNGRRR